MPRGVIGSVSALGLASRGDARLSRLATTTTLRRSQLIDTVVVIYAENRSFDNLYGNFPGANGLANASSTAICSSIATARR